MSPPVEPAIPTVSFDAGELRVRRCDLWLVSYIWTMSNGLISRRLGRLGWLLIPVSGPAHLLVACALRRSLVRVDRAVIQVRPSRRAARPDYPLALLVALPAALAVWAGVLLLPALLISAAGGSAAGLLIGPTALLLIGPDVAAEPLIGAWARLRHGLPALAPAATELGCAALAGLASYPRGLGHGEQLMRRLNVLFDKQVVSAMFDVRTAALATWYERLGYRTVEFHRMVRMPEIDNL